MQVLKKLIRIVLKTIDPSLSFLIFWLNFTGSNGIVKLFVVLTFNFLVYMFTCHNFLISHVIQTNYEHWNYGFCSRKNETYRGATELIIN